MPDDKLPAPANPVQLDLTQVASDVNYNLKIKRETPEERAASLQMKAEDAREKRFLRRWILVGLACVVAACLTVLVMPKATEAQRDIASKVLLAVISAAVGNALPKVKGEASSAEE